MGAEITAITVMFSALIIGSVAQWRLSRRHGLLWRGAVFSVASIIAVAIMLIAIVLAIHQFGSGR